MESHSESDIFFRVTNELVGNLEKPSDYRYPLKSITSYDNIDYTYKLNERRIVTENLHIQIWLVYICSNWMFSKSEHN